MFNNYSLAVSTVLISSIISATSFAASSKSAPPAVAIESIQGADTVTITHGGSTEQKSKGAAIEGGDHVKTGIETVRLIYAGGSQILIGKNTDLEIIVPEVGVQWNYLHRGQVRAVVAKTNKPKKLLNSYHFGIRTKSSVAGVRGTDFTVETDEKGEKSTVHTLDGQVDVAKDQPSLLSGKGLALLKDHFVTGNLSEALANPTKFDRAQYLSELKQKQPGFGDIMKKAPDTFKGLEKYKDKFKNGFQNKSAPGTSAVPSVSSLKDSAKEKLGNMKAPVLPGAPSAPSKPNLPAVSIPDLKPADVKAPEIKAPEIKVPQVKNPFGR